VGLKNTVQRDIASKGMLHTEDKIFTALSSVDTDEE
jgi:hypothetical protein